MHLNSLMPHMQHPLFSAVWTQPGLFCFSGVYGRVRNLQQLAFHSCLLDACVSQFFTAVHYMHVPPALHSCSLHACDPTSSSQLFTTCVFPPALHSHSLHACVPQLFTAVHYMPVSHSSSQLFTTCLCPPALRSCSLHACVPQLFTAVHYMPVTPALHSCSLHSCVPQIFTAVHHMPVSTSSSQQFTTCLCSPALRSCSLHACVPQLFTTVHYMPVSPQLFAAVHCMPVYPSSSRLFTTCLCSPALHSCSLHAGVPQLFTSVH